MSWRKLLTVIIHLAVSIVSGIWSDKDKNIRHLCWIKLYIFYYFWRYKIIYALLLYIGLASQPAASLRADYILPQGTKLVNVFLYRSKHFSAQNVSGVFVCPFFYSFFFLISSSISKRQFSLKQCYRNQPVQKSFIDRYSWPGLQNSLPLYKVIDIKYKEIERTNLLVV